MHQKFLCEEKVYKEKNSFKYFSWFAGLLTVAVLAGALAFSSLLLHNDDAKRKVQDVLTTVLGVTLKSSKQTPDEKIEVEHELDVAIESFFKRIVSTFIISWYSNITQDEAFSFFVKLQITKVVREIALRLRDVSGTYLNKEANKLCD